MALEILKPGLSTTVQDLGRPGYYHLGIPESGAMDKFSLAAANLLVGNPEGAAGPRLAGAPPGDLTAAPSGRMMSTVGHPAVGDPALALGG